MTTSNKDLMYQGRQALSGKWGMAVSAYLIYIVIALSLYIFGSGWDMITGALSSNDISDISPISTALSLIIGGPFALGVAIFSLSIARGDEDSKIEQIFWGFRSFIKALFTYIIMLIFILLWTALLVIPGIIMGIAYSQAFYILADDPDINPIDAIRKSREIMKGYKWKFFCLNLRFIGWAILCLFTLGIGYLWLAPYLKVTMAKFYDEIKDRSSKETQAEAPLTA